MISVIIPTYNEEVLIRSTVSKVISLGGALISEVIVSDGFSTDNTILEAKAAGAKVIFSEKKGRAAQMNEGANAAIGSILYFIHADSLPATHFAEEIINATTQGFTSGCFRLAFDYDHWFLKTQAWCTRFDIDAFRYGDQSLFVLKDVFTKCKGFDDALVFFEDNEIIKRIKRFGSFKVLTGKVTTSARKYRTNGVLKTQFVFYLLFVCYVFKFSQELLLKIFKSCLKQDKM